MSIEAGSSASWLEASNRRLHQQRASREAPVSSIRPVVIEAAPQPILPETQPPAMGEVVIFSRSMLRNNQSRPASGMSIPEIRRELAGMAVHEARLAKAA